MNNIVLLYSDISKGMKSYGAKALIANGNTPLVVKQIYQIQKQIKDNSRIHIVLGFDKSRIIDVLKKNGLYSKINIIDNPNYVKENQGQGFIEAIKQVDRGGCYIISNGILTSHILLDYNENIVPVLKRKADSVESCFPIGVRTDNGIAKYFFYDLEYEWPESCYFCPKDYNSIRNAILSNTSEKQQNGMFLFEHLNRLIDQSFVLKTQIVPNKQFKKILSYNK